MNRGKLKNLMKKKRKQKEKLRKKQKKTVAPAAAPPKQKTKAQSPVYDITKVLVSRIEEKLKAIPDKQKLSDHKFVNEILTVEISESKLDDDTKIMALNFIVNYLVSFISKEVSVDTALKYWSKNTWHGFQANPQNDHIDALDTILSGCNQILDQIEDVEILDQELIDRIKSKTIDEKLLTDLLGLVKNDQGHFHSEEEISFGV